MDFLYKDVEKSKLFDQYKELPKYIPDSLNKELELRPYQKEAFQNFITYYENDKMCNHRFVHNMFHMATGSGKTLIIAGLIVYLFKHGYRNFLFFVNSTSIIEKTKDNFLNPKSKKYLFADKISIEGVEIPIKNINTFDDSDPDSINICFSTIQGLHENLKEYREGSLTFEEFADVKTVLISDEAHHINADTKKGKMDEDTKSWEQTVQRMFISNKENILLEFTATCDLHNPNILAKYVDKIIFNYDLKKYREDKYSKEINTLATDIPLMDRALQAIVLSQYRLKVFEDIQNEQIKPIILFKSPTIAASKDFFSAFTEMVSSLRGSKIMELYEQRKNEPESDLMLNVYNYFYTDDPTFEYLAAELKEYFSPVHCIEVNSKSESETKQLVLNDLENPDNPYRAVFAVDMLNEGWDVLNLFDIVRVKETRNGDSAKVIGKETIAEAQLIGRGARYYPFEYKKDGLDKRKRRYLRKFDDDLDNPLRVCEELYYHCQFDEHGRYITELKRALKETGILSVPKRCEYRLKQDFKDTSFYQRGIVFLNDQYVKSRQEVHSLSPKIKDATYAYNVHTGHSINEFLIEDTATSVIVDDVKTCTITIGEVATLNYNAVHSGLRKFDRFRFDKLHYLFPQLQSINEFITSPDYLGNIRMTISGKSPFRLADYHEAVVKTLKEIELHLANITETYGGTTTFKGKLFKDLFRDKKVEYSDPVGLLGLSQKDPMVPHEIRLDLSAEDWFVFNDNYGTGEEKAFVAFFKTYIDRLKEKYKKVYLVRNERHVHIYSFDDGLRFEPDYLMFLIKDDDTGSYEQLQIFVEPKGAHLLDRDLWKEQFLLQIKEKNIKGIVPIADGNNYRVWGLPFFNKEERMPQFRDSFEELL